MEINEQQNRLDKLDKRGDKKISLVEGQNEKLTKVYITKVDKLQEELVEFSPQEKEKARGEIYEALKIIDATNVDSGKDSFNRKVDSFLIKANERRELRLMVEKIGHQCWTELGPGSEIKQIYEVLTKQGQGITKKQVLLLQSYVQISGEIGNKYREGASYFLEDKKPTLSNDKNLDRYISTKIAKDILSGDLPKFDNLTSGFREIAEKIGGKKEECMKFQSALEEMPKGPITSALIGDREKVIEIYLVISKRNISPETVGSIIKKIFYSGDFAPVSESGWKNPEELKIFLMESLLRGGAEGEVDNNEIGKIRAELYAKKLHSVEESAIISKIEENNEKAAAHASAQADFKSTFTHEGLLYANCLLDSSVLSSDPANKRGNFQTLVEHERDQVITKANQKHLEISQTINDARYLASIYVIEQAKNPDEMKREIDDIFSLSYENLKSRYGKMLSNSSPIFSKVETLQAEYLVVKNDVEEKRALLNSKNLLKGELIYRQTLEKGGVMNNEVVNNAVLARKSNELQVSRKSQEEIGRQISDIALSVEELIAEYGNINLVPAEKRIIASSKSGHLLKLLEISNRYLSRIICTDVEIKLIDPVKGLSDKEKKSYTDRASQQKELFEKTGEFMTGEVVKIPDVDVSGPEIQSLMLGQLQEKISTKVGNAIDPMVSASQDVGHYFNSQISSKIYKQISGSYVDVLNNGIQKTDKMISAIREGRAGLMSARADLISALDDNEGVLKDHPEMVKSRKKLIAQLVKGIDNLLHSEFSPIQEEEVVKARNKLEEVKEDMFWDAVKFAAVFFLSIGAALLTGGIFAAGAGRLFSLARVGERAHKIVTFAAGNVGVAAGTTVGSRLATHLVNEVTPGSEWKVNWSARAMATEFGTALGMSVAFTGAGSLMGERMAIRAAIKHGGEFTYAELAEAGLTKLGFVQKMLNPLQGRESVAPKNALQKFKSGGRALITETAEEAGQELGDAIDPRLGGIMAMISASHGPNIDIETQTKVNEGLKEIGVEYNPMLKRLEFKQNNAKDFGIDLIKNLGTVQNELAMSANGDGSFSMRIKGAENIYTIHPSGVESTTEGGNLIEELKQAKEDREIVSMMKEVKSPKLLKEVQKIYDNLYQKATTMTKQGFEWTARALMDSREKIENIGEYGTRFFYILDSKLMEVGKMRSFGSVLQDFYQSLVEAGNKGGKEKKTGIGQNSSETIKRRVNSERREYSEVVRETEVVYMPDIHGDVQALRQSLEVQGLINREGDWMGGEKVIQFSGDYIDRGNTNLATLDFISKLKKQAEERGGRVDLLVGNHEAMMIGAMLGDEVNAFNWHAQGDSMIQEVIVKYGLKYDDFKGATNVLRRECMEPGGKYYEIFNSFKLASQVDDVLYVHAGVGPKWAKILKDKGIEGVNGMWKTAIEKAKKGNFKSFDELTEVGAGRSGGATQGGLLWIDFQTEIETMSDRDVKVVAQNLNNMGINAIVVGHSRVNSPTMAKNFERYGIKLIASDTSMSHAYSETGSSGFGGVKIEKTGDIHAYSREGFFPLYAEKKVERKEKPVPKFEGEVYVQRRSGNLEKGWRITEYESDDSTYTLIKELPDGTMAIKEGVTEDQLSEWQRKASIVDVNEKDQARKEDKLMAELYPRGLLKSEVEQSENVGDCYLVAALQAFKRNPMFKQILGRTITKKSKGEWEVKFLGMTAHEPSIIITKADLKAQVVTNRKTGEVELKMPMKGDLGDLIIERALGRMHRLRRENRNKFWGIVSGQPISGDTRAILDEGGYGADVLSMMLGDYGKITEIRTSIIKNTTIDQDEGAMAKIERFLNRASQNPSEFVITVSTPSHMETPYYREGGHREFREKRHYYMDKERFFPQRHAYSVTDINGEKGTITVVNPHNSKNLRKTLTFKEFYKIFSGISAVELNADKVGKDFKVEFSPKEKGVIGKKLSPLETYSYPIDKGQSIYVHLGKIFQFSVERVGADRLYIKGPNNEILGRVLRGEPPVSFGRENLGSPSQLVSRSHVAISFSEVGDVDIKDLNSANGTEVVAIMDQGGKLYYDLPTRQNVADKREDFESYERQTPVSPQKTEKLMPKPEVAPYSAESVGKNYEVLFGKVERLGKIIPEANEYLIMVLKEFMQYESFGLYYKNPQQAIDVLGVNFTKIVRNTGMILGREVDRLDTRSRGLAIDMLENIVAHLGRHHPLIRAYTNELFEETGIETDWYEDDNVIFKSLNKQ